MIIFIHTFLTAIKEFNQSILVLMGNIIKDSMTFKVDLLNNILLISFKKSKSNNTNIQFKIKTTMIKYFYYKILNYLLRRRLKKQYIK